MVPYPETAATAQSAGRWPPLEGFTSRTPTTTAPRPLITRAMCRAIVAAGPFKLLVVPATAPSLSSETDDEQHVWLGLERRAICYRKCDHGIRSRRAQQLLRIVLILARIEK